MIANEFWGKPNARSPWSLWKMNALLCRKPISAGWKAKSPPPFRPIYKLMLDLSLPANILNAFHIHCGAESLNNWVNQITTIADICAVSQLVLDEHCSGRHVEVLHRVPSHKRDVPLENIILFNQDALYLQQLKYAVKKGDVGVVLDLCTHLMLAFRGTGKTPKYADALFGIVMKLKSMEPQLRWDISPLTLWSITDLITSFSDTWLNNWLANLTGKVNGFKEMDLLQEHQNFWLKVRRCLFWLIMADIYVILGDI